MNKKTFILGGILIVLVAFAYLYQGPLKKWQAGLGKSPNFLAKVDAKRIDKIEIVKEGKIVILEKQNDRYKVGGTKDFYVEQVTADSLINEIEEAAKADLELVSSNKDKKGELKTDDSGVRVKLYQTGNMVADFIIGKMGSDFSSTYISTPNTDKTYSLGVNLSVFNQPEWRDRTIFSSDKEKINKIRFQYPTQEFTVEKINDEWKGTKPYSFSVSKEKIDKILDMMSDSTAVEIPEQNFAGTGLEKNNIIIQATGDGVDNTLMIGDNNKDGNYYAKRGNSDNIYLITKSQRDELNKKIQELK
jgi:hypothetical protein